MVSMSAKATEPLMDPEIDTMDNSLLVTVHFFLRKSLKRNERPKMEMNLAKIHMNSSKARKVNDITSCVI